MMFLGDFIANSTVRFFWNTNAADGTSITRGTNGSIRIYKGVSTAERTSSSGITDTVDFDGLTGVHLCAVNLADNADAGFYAAGNDYRVVIAGAVVDGKTINAVLAEFSIQNRPVIISSGTGTGQLNVTSGVIQADVSKISGDSAAADNAESFFDGTGYGPLIKRTTVATVSSQTVLVLSSGPEVAGSLIGCTVLIRDVAGSSCVIVAKIANYDDAGPTITIDVDGSATFTIAVGDVVEILAPTFTGEDRTAAATLYSALTSAQSEPGQGNPAANASPLTKLAYLFKWKRNKITSTGSEINYYGENETTIDQTQSVSLSAGTVTKGEMITGA